MKQRNFLKDSSGSIAISTIVLMVVFVGLMAIVIDLGHLFTVQSELRNAADACALRGARAFLPDDIPTTGVSDEEPDPVNAKQEAYNTIQVNKSDHTNFILGDLPMADIQVGIWDYDARDWVGGAPTWSWPPDPSYWGKYIGPGVTLPTKRTESSSLGAVAMTLAQVFGTNTVPVSTMATAALSGVGELDEGYPGCFPIAINKDLLTTPDSTIYLSPDTSDVGGWTVLSLDNTNAADVKKLINHKATTPTVTTGDSISLLNGSACSILKEAIDYYTNETTIEDPKGVYKLDPPIEVVFPVVTEYKFNQSAEVVGFMSATIPWFIDTNAAPGTPIPDTSPPQVTNGHCVIIIKPKLGDTGNLPGGGAWFGFLSPQPRLVQ
jgi:Putative Flp pilus-assembly TadE/G-like